MEKLYINHNLEICANEKGWPVFDYNPTLHDYNKKVAMFNEALAQAKQESVPFEDQRQIWTALESPAFGNRDSFIEFAGEVEFVTQYRKRDSNDAWSDHGNSYNFQETRKVAHLKHPNAARSYSEGADMYQVWDKENKDLKIVSSDTVIEGLRAQLAAAEKRVKELEEWKRQEISLWLPILDYCQHNKNADRLGIRLGDSITKRILEILKNYAEL